MKSINLCQLNTPVSIHLYLTLVSIHLYLSLAYELNI